MRWAGSSRPAGRPPSRSSMLARTRRWVGSSVALSPDQMKTWMDTRPYANSPWSPPYIVPEPPPQNRWMTTATFKEPGSYVLRAVASDGSLFTYDDVTVEVDP